MRYNYESIEQSLINQIDSEKKLSFKKLIAIVELSSIASLKSNLIG